MYVGFLWTLNQNCVAPESSQECARSPYVLCIGITSIGRETMFTVSVRWSYQKWNISHAFQTSELLILHLLVTIFMVKRCGWYEFEVKIACTLNFQVGRIVAAKCRYSMYWRRFKDLQWHWFWEWAGGNRRYAANAGEGIAPMTSSSTRHTLLSIGSW